MSQSELTRRQFLGTSAVVAGAALVGPLIGHAAAQAVKHTATDLVTLGNTGLKITRLGIGTGLDNGRQMLPLGQDGFNALVKHAWDRGIRYIDTCERYVTFPWIANAIKPLPREQLFLLSKVSGTPRDVMAAIDEQRKICNTDYFDALLIHSQTVAGWSAMDSWKIVMDAFIAAKEKQWIKSKGISCHNLPALTDAVGTDFNEVHLVRVNPMGKYVDGPSGRGYTAAETYPVEPVLEQIKVMKEKGRGVIGMKIFGNGLFTDPADRDKSLKFALSNPNIDAVVIGFKTIAELDEGIDRMNRVLAEG
jgi:predicted aldo/keto reductase-like oxidoreductase